MSKEPIKKLPSLDLTKASPDPKDLPIILIGETHCDQAPSLLLQELMPFFKEMGYGFCFETDSRNSLDQAIKKYREMIGHFDRFIPEQSSEIAKLGGWLDPKNSKEIISQIIKSFNKQQHESNIIGMVTNSRNEDKLENFGTAESSIKAELVDQILKPEDKFRSQKLLALINRQRNYVRALATSSMIGLFELVGRLEMPFSAIDVAEDEIEKITVRERNDFMFQRISEKESPQVVVVGLSHILPLSKRLRESGRKVLNFAVTGINHPYHDSFYNEKNAGFLDGSGITLIDFRGENIAKDYSGEIAKRILDAESLIRLKTIENSASYKKECDPTVTSIILGDITKANFLVYLRHDDENVDAVLSEKDPKIIANVAAVLTERGISFSIKNLKDGDKYLVVDKINSSEIAQKIAKAATPLKTAIATDHSALSGGAPKQNYDI